MLKEYRPVRATNSALHYVARYQGYARTSDNLSFSVSYHSKVQFFPPLITKMLRCTRVVKMRARSYERKQFS